MRATTLFLLMGLAGCAASESPDVIAARAVSMSTPAVSWQELRVHPALMQRACAVSTLVNEDGQVVGYCRGGRQCRTMDWRPVLDGCGGPDAPVQVRQEPGRQQPSGKPTEVAQGR
ncbi:MAG: hypothetical protein QJR07_18150 [Acetobacteraceae bacterium]|nr:hypothetical protein [Acetobacteraceae bacterium]